MPSFVDLSGHRFGRLLVVSVISKASKTSGKRIDTVWLCRCDCGKEHHVQRGNLKNGSVQSCGCFRNTQGGHSNKHPQWARWHHMIARCTKPSSKDYENYGGRGIIVCSRWRSFPLFLEDMGGTFFEGATLERNNNDGDYEPGNVRWATPQEQLWNQRKTVFIDTPWGKMSRGEAAKRAGVPIGRFISRVNNGWPMDRLFDPKNQEKLSRWSRRS